MFEKRKTAGFMLMIFMTAVSGTLLAGCGDEKEEIQTLEVETISLEEKEEISSEAAENSGQQEEMTAETEETSDGENATAVSEEEQTFVYIGTQNAGFKKYPVDIAVTPECGNDLVAAIAGLTGWNLNMSDDVISGKGGVSVTFSKDCALVTGPPEEQKEEFFVYDSYQLAQTILDSIQETLRQNFVQAPGNPEDLDVWFSIEDEPIEIEGVTISLEEPYGDQKVFGLE